MAALGATVQQCVLRLLNMRGESATWAELGQGPTKNHARRTRLFVSPEATIAFGRYKSAEAPQRR